MSKAEFKKFFQTL